MIFRVYFIFIFFTIINIPLFAYLSKTFVQIKDGLWAFGRFLMWFILSIIIFFIAWLKMPANNVFGVYILLLLISLLDIYLLFFSKHKQKNLKLIQNYWKKFRRQIIIEELLFLAFFSFLLIVRSFQPEILGLEKFMDAGFIQVYLKSSTLPASDMCLLEKQLIIIVLAILWALS
jgi:uncharacterized membrane protein